MNKSTLYGLKIIFILIIQILVLNGLNLHGTVQPYVYPLILIMLPVGMMSWMVLTIAFFVGLMVDFDLNSGALHAATLVLLGFLRPLIFTIFLRTTKNLEKDTTPSIAFMGIGVYWRYALVMLAIHHVGLFLIEPYAFQEPFTLLLRIIFSLAISFSLLMLIDISINSLEGKRKPI